MKKVYLDYAAATPMAGQVREAMAPYYDKLFHNPSATYLAGRTARAELESIRHRIAAVIGARPAEIIFTAGATEANNLAVQGIMDRYDGSEMLYSAIEHESVIGPAAKYPSGEIPVDSKGLIILNKLSNLINDRTVLVSVMLVNNELGTIQPLREISAAIGQVRRERAAKGNDLPIFLHTDAAQAANYLGIHTSRLGVDLMSVNGGKIYGPKQSGFLFVKAGTSVEPLIRGGGQEFGLRSGTENLAAAAGLAVALEMAASGRKAESVRVSGLRQEFETGLGGLAVAVTINGSKHRRAPHLVSAVFTGIDNERLMMELDEAGIMCAIGSACSASRHEASHVLSAIGLDDTAARSTLRFSFGRHTTADDIRRTIGTLARLTDSNR